MAIYYSIRALANILNTLRENIFEMAVAIQRVWLLGDNLYAWLSSISAFIGLFVNRTYLLANEWLSVYNELRSGVVSLPGIGVLLYYVNQLVDLVVNFSFKVHTIIRTLFPAIYEFALNPVSYVLTILYRNTGLTYDFVFNPRAVILSIINVALGDLRNLIANPYAYIIGKLTQGNPRLYYLFISPVTWLRLILSELSPAIMQFLDDPAAYVLDAFVNGVERLFSRYGVRLAKVAEKIINAMF